MLYILCFHKNKGNKGNKGNSPFPLDPMLENYNYNFFIWVLKSMCIIVA